MKLTGILAYVFWLPAVIFLARYDLRTDDTGVEVFFLLAITFILGTLHPRHAWQWALLVGPAIPLAEMAFGHPQAPAGMALLLAVLIALGMAGSYMGAGLRRIAGF
jgi:hypothetical protein